MESRLAGVSKGRQEFQARGVLNQQHSLILFMNIHNSNRSISMKHKAVRVLTMMVLFCSEKKSAFAVTAVCDDAGFGLERFLPGARL